MTVPPHRYTGAAAMILLHEAQMRDFLAVWREAKASGLALPQTEDTDYASLETLLRHVLGAAGGYMIWCCASLGLPDPGIPAPPPAEAIEAAADDVLEQVLGAWRTPLADVPEVRFGEEHKSRWGIVYCIDSMLEHAVMHPLRHAFQLRRLMAARNG